MLTSRRWLRWLLLLPLGLLGWSVAALLWIGPAWVEREFPRRLSEALGGKPVTVESVESDLLRLSFRVKGLSIRSENGREMASCPELWVGAEWSSLAGGDPRFSSLRLDSPVLRLRKGPEGWLDGWALAGKSDKPFRIKKIEVTNASVDLASDNAPARLLAGIGLELSDLDSSSGADLRATFSPDASARLTAEGRIFLSGTELFKGKVACSGAQASTLALLTEAAAGIWMEGSLTAEAMVSLTRSPDGLAASLSEGTATLVKPVFTHLGSLRIKADRMEAQGLALGFPGASLALRKVEASGGGIFGSFPSSPAADPAPPNVPWSVDLLEWKGFDVSLATPEPVPRILALNGLDLSLGKLASGWEKTAAFLGPLALPSLPWRISGKFAGGVLQAEGGNGSPLSLSVRDAGLLDLKPWLSLPPAFGGLAGTATVSMRVANSGTQWSGDLSAELSQPSYEYAGLGVQKAAYARLLSKVSGTRGDFVPREVSSDLTARGARVSLRRNQDLSWNVPWAAFSAGPGQPTRWNLGRLVIEEAEVDIDDRAVEPAFHAVCQFQGELGPPGAEGNRDFEARGTLAGNAGLIKAKGNAHLPDPRRHFFLECSTQGFELAPLSPWLSRYAETPVASGLADAACTVVVVDGKLKARNEFRFENLAFSPSSRGPLPGDLPLARMASLLRDRKGVVKLSLPVEGDVTQPSFRYSSALWAALGRTSTRILSAPLRALAEVFGSEEPELGEVDRIRFEANSAEIPPYAVPLLNGLASFLKERPGISLRISGGANHAETHYLRREALAVMLEEALGHPPESYEESVQALRSEYAKAFPGELKSPETEPSAPQPPAEAAKAALWKRILNRLQLFPPRESPPSREAPAAPPAPNRTGLARLFSDPADPLPNEMEERLLETIVVPISALDELAAMRARAVRDFLVSHGVEPARLATVEVSLENAAAVRIRLP